MSVKNTKLTQDQFNTLKISSDWKIVELMDMAIIQNIPGIQRKGDALACFTSGELKHPIVYHGVSSILAFDYLVYEPHPKTQGEGSINAYHYIIQTTEDRNFPYILSEPYNKETNIPHWPKELDLTPYEQNH